MLYGTPRGGGLGYEKNTGDGAGILTTLPHKFLRRTVQEALGIELPAPGKYGTGIIFLPQDDGERTVCKSFVKRSVEDSGLTLLGWRNVPIDPDTADIGPTARAAMPAIEQIFVGGDAGLAGDEIERKLYVARKKASHRVRDNGTIKQQKLFYVNTLSSRVIVYKGMLTPAQLFPFYQDLQQPDFESHLVV